MRNVLAVFTASIAVSASLLCAQPSPNAAPAPNPPANALPTVTSTLHPALESVHKTLDGLHLDKWKKGSIRDEAGQNISQIVRDIDLNLPPLLQTADATPGTLSNVLPVSRNVNALYDVLLRVSEAARISGPDDQAAQLQQALLTLGNARIALGDRIQGSADALEKQVVDLRATIQTDAAQRTTVPVPVALPCIPPPVHHTTKKATAKPPAKPAPKPATPTTTPPAPNNPSNKIANSQDPETTVSDSCDFFPLQG